MELVSHVFAQAPCVDDSPLDEQVRAGMEKATRYMTSLANHGGYLFFYTPDLSQQAGEQMADDTQIWIQPPGTPTMGMAFLTAYEVTHEPLYIEAAAEAALALAQCQLPSGGWHYSGDFDPDRPNQDGQRSFQGEQALGGKYPDNPHYFMATVFDDNNTQSAMRFLMRYLDVAEKADMPVDPQIQTALDRSLQCLLDAQYPNGAWPQRYTGESRNLPDYPIRPASFPEDYPKHWPDLDYTAYYTLNDGSQRDCIFVMFEAYRRYGRPEYREAAIKGADFILLAQLPEPQAGWAQQYDFEMHPVWARKMEPPGVSSAETRASMEALLKIHKETGDEKYLLAIDPAIEWLQTSAIGPNRWARLYEMNTNRPIYGGNDGHVYYEVEKGRRGYNWQSSYGIPEFIRTYQELPKIPHAPKSPASKQEITVAEVEEILMQIDEQGRWITSGHKSKFPKEQPLVSTKTYTKNMTRLARFLNGAGWPRPIDENE